MGDGRTVLSAGEHPEDLADLASRHRDAFRETFQGTGEVRLFFSPGRVNLMGAHLDYNGGAVMPTAIDRGTLLGVRAREDGRVRLATTHAPEGFEASLDRLPRERTGSWVDYPIGVIRQLRGEAREPVGFDLLVGGNLPIGAGLSSSASVTVGTAVALDALWNLRAEPRRLIAAALFAEREFVGVHCGIMDPFAVLLSRPAHLLWIDCTDEVVEHLPFGAAGEVRIAVADTGVRRELARGAFNERVAECARAFEFLRLHQDGARCLAEIRPETLEQHAGSLDANVFARAQHVVSEVARTEDARKALLDGDLARFGGNMTAAHTSLRDLFEVSVPELDHLVDRALEWDGVLGTRLTGAGFGGCIVVLLTAEACNGFEAHLGSTYRKAFGREIDVRFFGGGGGPRELP